MATYDNIKFVGGGVTVFVATSKVEENYTNAIKLNKVPSTESTPVTTNLINLNKVEQRFTVTGHLNYGTLDVSDSHTTAKAKKDALRTMFSEGAVVQFTYEGTTYDVGVDKYQITDKSMDNTDSFDTEIVYDVTISCVVGADLV